MVYSLVVVDASTSVWVRPDGIIDPVLGNLPHKIIPVITKKMVAFIRRVYTISQEGRGERCEVHGQHMLAGVATLLCHAWHERLKLLCAGGLLRVARVDNHCDEDNSVWTGVENLVHELSKPLSRAGWVVAFRGDGGVGVHVIGACCHEYDIGLLGKGLV